MTTEPMIPCRELTLIVTL